MQLDDDARLIGAGGETCKNLKLLPVGVRRLKLAASADRVLARVVVEAVEPVQFARCAFRRELEENLHVGFVHWLEQLCAAMNSLTRYQQREKSQHCAGLVCTRFCCYCCIDVGHTRDCRVYDEDRM